MKSQYIFFLILLISCQKPKPAPQITSVKSKAKVEEITAKENSLRTDTIILDKNAEITHIIIHLTEQKPDKDSIIESKFRLDFYKNKNKIVSKKITLQGMKKDLNGADPMVFPIHLKTTPLL